jgi:hypothetical protein
MICSKEGCAPVLLTRLAGHGMAFFWLAGHFGSGAVAGQQSADFLIPELRRLGIATPKNIF